jgi:hypothetical protein
VVPKSPRTRKGWLLAVPLVLAAFFALWVALREPAPLEALSNEPKTSHAPAIPHAVELAKVDARETVPVEKAPPPPSSEPAPSPDPPELEIVDFEEMGPTPPDPVELGNAVLDLQLLDAATEQPVASYVELWRIDAPENESWTAGDQLQDQAQVPVEGWAFRRLPEGRYRVVCHAQVWGEDPPELEVRAPRTRASLSIETPRAFRIHLDVRDRFGAQVADLHLTGKNEELLDPHDDWRNHRSLKASAGAWMSVGYGGGWGFNEWSSHGAQPADGFDLGMHSEADRGGHRRTVWDLATGDGRRLRLRFPPRMDADQYLIAVVLSASEIEPLVRVPPSCSAQIELEVVGEPIQRDPSLPGGGWERAPVSITVRGEGLRAFEHTWRAADGELPSIVLEPEP